MNTEKKAYTPHQMSLIEKYRNVDMEDTEWASHTVDEFKAACEAYGIDVYDIEWDVSCCQGSGASFDANPFAIDEILTKGRDVMLLAAEDDLSWLKDATSPVASALRDMFQRLEEKWGTILLSSEALDLTSQARFNPTTSSSHYCHSGRMYVEMEWNGDEKEDYNARTQQMISDLEDEAELLQEEFRHIANALHTELEDEAEYRTSDDAVWEMIEANDLETPEPTDEEDKAAERLAA